MRMNQRITNDYMPWHVGLGPPYRTSGLRHSRRALSLPFNPGEMARAPVQKEDRCRSIPRRIWRVYDAPGVS